MVLLVFCVTAYAETVTLSTYYPAPFGSYDRLRLVPRDLPTCDATMQGTMIYQDSTPAAGLTSSIYVCNGTSWDEAAEGIWDVNRAATPMDVFIDGSVTNPQVGIGTNAPVNTLDVEGGAAIGAAYSGTSAAPANGLIIEGNVGIGKNSAAQRLDVSGNAAVSGTITSGTGITATTGGFTASAGNLSIAGTSTLTGNVGIGGAAPSGTANTDLDVSNDVYVRGNVGIGIVPNTTASTDLDVNTNAYIRGNIGVGAVPSATAATDLDVGNNARISGNLGLGRDPHATYDLDVNADALVRGNLRLGANEGILRVGYTATAPAGYYAVYAP